MQTIDQVAVNTLRFLSIDEVEKTKSGHPGFPLVTGPLRYTVWYRFMNYSLNAVSYIYLTLTTRDLV